MFELEGKRALVCGGTSGIGKATVEVLKKSGATVVSLARTAKGKNAITCDLEDLDMLTTLVNKEIDENGNFEILINNSGGPPSGPAPGQGPTAGCAARCPSPPRLPRLPQRRRRRRCRRSPGRAGGRRPG